MLTADLIRTWKKGPYIGPKYIEVGSEEYLRIANELIEIFSQHRGRRRDELRTSLRAHIADSPDYLIHRGLAKLLLDRTEFQVVKGSGVEPRVLRERIFSLSSENAPVVLTPDMIHPVTKKDILETVASELNTVPGVLLSDMYSDLPQNHILSTFDPPAPEWLLGRYNVALAQGVLYHCVRMRVIAYRNIPVRYKQLFKFIKFYGLMHSITGDLDSGYEIILDGPLSMFRLSRKYGIHMANFLPALLLCTRWKMEAEILTGQDEKRYFVLSSTDHKLDSHYRDATDYDSLLEESFADRFEKIESDWAIERETEIVNLKDTVFIPDFAFRNKVDGRVGLFEIVGFWRSDYLKRKLSKLKRAGLENLIVAVSENLNASREDFEEVPGSVFFFKTSIDPKEVIRRLEEVAV